MGPQGEGVTSILVHVFVLWFGGFWLHFAKFQQKWLQKKCKQSLSGDHFSQGISYILLILIGYMLPCKSSPISIKSIKDLKVLRQPSDGGHKDLTQPTDKLTGPCFYNVTLPETLRNFGDVSLLWSTQFPGPIFFRRTVFAEGHTELAQIIQVFQLLKVFQGKNLKSLFSSLDFDPRRTGTLLLFWGNYNSILLWFSPSAKEIRDTYDSYERIGGK